MSKMLLQGLLIALVMFAGWEKQLKHPQALPLKADNHSFQAESAPIAVQVTFDGLMVFEKVGNRYEVGILARNDHDFKIALGKGDAKKLDQTVARLISSPDPWVLQIESSSGSPKRPQIWPRDNKECKRQQDTVSNESIDHAFDFCWVMDLEREFHGRAAIKLKTGKLNPIIWLNHGELYTKYKYDELEREKTPKGKDWSPYGFVAETIGLRVELQASEQLVLRNGKDKVFSLPSKEGDLAAAILNAPRKDYHLMRRPDRRSHFIYYYDLSDDFKDREKVDIQLKEKGALRPLNRWVQSKDHRMFDDLLRPLTFDDQACGGIFLGESKIGLSR